MNFDQLKRSLYHYVGRDAHELAIWHFNQLALHGKLTTEDDSPVERLVRVPVQEPVDDE